MLALCIQIVFAGYETSVNFIANAMLTLLQNPAELTRLQQEPALLPNAINELFRFTGSVQTTAARRPKEDV